jgi:hypothetical protein
MIGYILAKLYGIILENKINIWHEIHRKKELKAKLALEDISQLWTIFLFLGSLQSSFQIIKPISFVVSLV